MQFNVRTDRQCFMCVPWCSGLWWRASGRWSSGWLQWCRGEPCVVQRKDWLQGAVHPQCCDRRTGGQSGAEPRSSTVHTGKVGHTHTHTDTNNHVRINAHNEIYSDESKKCYHHFSTEHSATKVKTMFVRREIRKLNLTLKRWADRRQHLVLWLISEVMIYLQIQASHRRRYVLKAYACNYEKSHEISDEPH